MEYEIIYSQRKTLTIALEKCKVVVKAPIGIKKSDIEKAITKHHDWIERNLAAQIRKATMFDNLTPEDINDLKKQARVYFAQKVEYFANIMNLKYGRVTITSAQKRFGSCSSTGNISFSYRLMLYPEPAREYVVVHELAHLVEMNHSSKFYQIIASVLPDYKSRKRLLK